MIYITNITIILLHSDPKITMTAAEISQKFYDDFSEVSEQISLKELKEKLSSIYKEKNAKKKSSKKEASKEDKKPSKKEDSDEEKTKKKRGPTAYNAFLKEQMAILREQNMLLPKEERPSVKDNMKKIAELWQEKKSQ